MERMQRMPEASSAIEGVLRFAAAGRAEREIPLGTGWEMVPGGAACELAGQQHVSSPIE